MELAQTVDSKEDEVVGVFGGLTRPLALMIPDVLSYRTERDLLRCGFYRPTAYDSYLAIRNVLVAGVLIASMTWAIVLSDQPRLVWGIGLIGLIAAIFSYSGPRVFLSLYGDQRANRIFADLPDAVDLLVMGLAGGLSLQQSLERTTSELRGISRNLAREFDIICRQTVADSLEHSLGRFAQRLDIDELTALTEAIQHASSMGTPLSFLLKEHAERLRHMRIQKAQHRGNTIALKMLFPTLFCLAPAAFIAILSPPLLELRSFREREKGPEGALSRESLSRQAKPVKPVQGRDRPGAP